MSDNNQAPATTQPPLEFPCPNPNCSSHNSGKKLRRKPPQPQILNSPTCSIIVYVHEQGITCQWCNAYFQLGIADLQAAIMWGLQVTERPTEIEIVKSLGPRLVT